ncbi:hypothetical protein BIU82_15060 [Arthrobacter sp. SW1]|uniref:hypothetical protein n=1 Tax=Arthrobacter sp. SW1 TaxID=1920889 RepID=UPI000877E00F|nr:hypothetical protein [Arthrobacter sp. SW1]OFI39185.1 hypothetical protein BIU82_15060 [Arthrobacter sp. SW1]
MTAALPWLTLIVCVAMTAVRIPSAIRGRNRTMFFLFALLSADILLSIKEPYLAIDAVLGGFNLANLLLRFMLYGTFLLLGVKTAAAFGSEAGLRAIRGPVGLAVLGLVAALTAWIFFTMDTRGSSVGLSGLHQNAALESYAALGRFYPGYVAVCLLPGIWKAVRSSAPTLLRIASATLFTGLVLLVLTQGFPLLPDGASWLRPVLNYSAALASALGMGGIWLSKSLARRTARG